MSAALLLGAGSIFISLNKNRSEHKTDKLQAPNDHFFLQRSWPEKNFPFNAYKTAIARVSNNLDRSASATGFNSPWRTEGPGNIGGRINCVVVHPTDPNTMLVGNASGGIFKTTDGGQSWNPVFDDHSWLSVGCIVYDPQNSNVLYAGTGDPNIGSSAFIGDGIYKSTDGGNTWTNSGLNVQGIISKIVIDPSNSNIIYAAAMGVPYFRDNNRGVYKSTDGGLTWTQKLFISNDAGVSDLLIDPSNPSVLYACGWNRIRNNHESVVTGPAGKIYKTTNGGNNWIPLAGGLPQSNVSRLAIAMSNQNSNTLYAVYVDNTLDFLDLFKTTDGGANWTAMNSYDLMNGAVYSNFGWYFGLIRLNPNNDNEIYIGGVDLFKSTDGGSTFSMYGPAWWTYEVHADKHDIIVVNDSTLILATDGGLYKTTDYGVSWTDLENIPNTQFYHVGYNPFQPSNYYGGAQDNGTTGGNATTINSWPRIFGGDGFKPDFHPTNPNIWYTETQNGGLVYSDDGGWNFYDCTNGIDPSDRIGWDMPYLISKDDPSKLYCATQYVYTMTSAPYGTWFPVSSDLTDGNIYGARFHTISCIEESAVNSNYLYAGTSDGNVWASTDGSSSWINITGSLPDRYVTSIKASPTNASVAWVSHSGYKENDFIPHIHKTTNNGTSWTNISGDLPQLAINDILPFPGNDNILFVATDGGVYGTVNGGTSWTRVGSNMPVLPVLDLELNPQENRIIAGTYGRSIMSFPIDSLPIPVGMKKNEAISLKLFPNPCADFICYENNSGTSEMKVYNLEGKLFGTFELKNFNGSIDLSSFPPGVYLTQIRNNNGEKITSSKFVKL